MGLYKLTETEVLAQPSDYVNESGLALTHRYETSDKGDGGYLDSFNALKEQVDFNYVEYKEQLRSLVERSNNVKEDMSYAFRMMIAVMIIPIIYLLVLKLLMMLGLSSGFFAMLAVILHILFYAVLAGCYLIFLPGMIKNYLNYAWQYKILTSGDSMKNYKEKNRIVSFMDEKEFLKNKIREFDSFYEGGIAQGLDKDDGDLGGNESGILMRDQSKVLDKMRALSVFREYKASVSETKKDVSFGFFVKFLAVLIGIFVLVVSFL